MVKLVIAASIIVGVCILLLSVSILFRKNGRFPNTHVSGSKEMRRRGITCVQSQDYAARHHATVVKE